MSDYTRNYDFSAKDNLSTGDPNKVIRGSEMDQELDDIVVAVNSKVDEPASPQERDIMVYESGAWARKANELMPAGAVVPYAGSTAPPNWLLCDGASYSTATYANLFAAIGYTHGGSGGTFKVPDMRGRAAFGKDDMGGTAANRISSSGAPGMDGTILGEVGGDEEHALVEGELAPHEHDMGNQQGFNIGGAEFIANIGQNDPPGSGRNTGSTGDGDPHNNMPPAIVLNYIIRI